jgi:hypothetical protein
LSKTVRAITRTNQHFQAVVLRQSGLGCELLSSVDNEQELPPADITVTGLNSNHVAFYRIVVPTAHDDQLGDMVRLQAESLLPLPIEQMEIAWRRGAVRQDKVGVTIAATRSALVERELADAKIYHPDFVLLEAEAVVKASERFFDCSTEKSIILHLGAFQTHVCLVESCQLVHAVTLDFSRDEILTAWDLAQTRVKQLEQDLRRSRELFQIENGSEIPLCLLCADGQSFQTLAQYLMAVGWRVNMAMPDPEKLMSKEPVTEQTIYTNIIPLGLGLLALDGEHKPLDVSQHLLTARKKTKSTFRLPSLKISAALAVLMLVVFGVVSYALDVRELDRLESSLEQVDAEVNINKLLEEQNIKKTIAAQRPDLLELLGVINSCGPDGVLLDNFNFKKGRAVTIGGQATSQEKIYEFQENLQKQDGITTVRIPNNTFDEKKKQVTFTITFDYKNFGG